MKHLILFLLLGSSGFSQSISKQVIGTAGKTQSNTNNSLSWTIGEPIVGLMTTGGNQLGNGYFPSLNVTALSREDFTIEVTIKVFPNPTSHYLFVEQKDHHDLEVLLTDLSGKIILQRIVASGESIDVSSWTQGMYFVQAKDTETNKNNSYKIIKK